MQRAEQYFKAGDYEKAKIEYLRVLRLDNGSSTASQRLGIIWFENGAPLYAYAYLFRARELAPENVETRSKLATVLVSIGEVTEAQREAITVLDTSPNQDEAILALAATIRTEHDVELAEEILWRIQEHKSAAYDLAWATIAIWKGDLEWAKSELHRAVELEPKSPRTHLAMANFYLAQGNHPVAEHEFGVAAELAPARSAARLKYAEFQVLTDRRDSAKAYLKQITQKAPDYLPAWRLLAQIAFDEKSWDESLALLQNVFDQDHVNIEARILEANIRLAKGDAAKAVEGLEGLDATYPNLPLIEYNLARAYLQNNDQLQAQNALDRAIGADPDYVEAVLLLGELNLQNGKAALVVGAMTGLLEKQPRLASAQSLLVRAYQALGRLDDAAAIVQEQIRASPEAPDAYFRLGLILRQQNKADEARNAFEKALELAPDNLSPIEQLVELDISDKDFDTAMRRVQQLKRTSNSAGACYLEGKIYAAQGKSDLAEAALRKAIDLDANFSSAHDLLIATFLAADKFPQAISQLEAVLSKSPGNTRALTKLALVYDEMMKDYPKARDAYEKLLSVNPDFVPALNNLAYLYAEHLNETDKAYELAHKARTLQPADASVADTLGWTLYKRADYQEAVAVLRESAGKLPNDPEVQFHLGMASYMMDQTEAARLALRQAVQATTDFPGKEEAQRRLVYLEDNARASQPRAVNELEAIVGKDPGDPITRMRLGEVYEKQGAFAKAAAAYEEALKVNPELPSAAVKLAQLNAGPLQNNNMAFAFAKTARDLAPNDPQIAGLLGDIVYELGNFSWAYSLLQESSFRLNSDAKILYDCAWAAYSLGKVSDARRTMRRVLEANPDPSRAEKAKSFMAMTDLEENPERLAASEPEIQKTLATDATYVPGLLARADLLLKRGDAKSAAGIYNDILRRFPDFAPAQKHLASIYLEDPARIDEAYDLALKASNTLPDDLELAQTLGEISYKRKDFAYAIQSLQESARKRPLRARGLYYLGMSQLRASQDSEAKKTLQQALAAGLQEPLSREAKAALDELQKRTSF